MSIKRVTWIVVGRLALIIFFILSHIIVIDHEASDVFRYQAKYSSELSSVLLKGFLCWDANYYISIARHGYLDLSHLAFYEGYPTAIRLLSLSLLGPIVPHWTEDERLIVSAVAISNISYIIAVVVFIRLMDIMRCDARVKTAACFCLMLSPIAIFSLTAYTESMFMAASWLGILLIEEARLRKDKATRVILAIASLAALLLSTSIRSNGLLGIVYYFPLAVDFLLGNGFSVFSCLQVIAAVILLWYLFTIQLNIQEQKIHSFLLSSSNSSSGGSDDMVSGESIICEKSLSHVWLGGPCYQAIQSKYWQVGLFRYYQWKQFPNFLLASPALFLAGYSLLSHSIHLPVPSIGDILQWRSVRWLLGTEEPSCCHWPLRTVLRWNSYTIHTLVLGAVGLLIANVQISTRLLFSSCPLMTLALADVLAGRNRSLRRLFTAYVLIYCFVGIVLHANFYPWT